mgnify:CR=1 FL=1
MDSIKEKHLEFIQNNITRMNNCSFQIKGWSLTIVSALLALYASSVKDVDGVAKGNTMFLIIGVLPEIVFWCLDSYYLQQERKFRGVYDDVAEISKEETRNKIKPFEMPLQYYQGGKYCFWRVFFSKTIWPIYLLVIAILVAGYFFL